MSDVAPNMGIPAMGMAGPYAMMLSQMTGANGVQGGQNAAGMSPYAMMMSALAAGGMGNQMQVRGGGKGKASVNMQINPLAALGMIGMLKQGIQGMGLHDGVNITPNDIVGGAAAAQGLPTATVDQLSNLPDTYAPWGAFS